MVFWRLLILAAVVEASFNASECGLTKNCYSIPANCHQHPNEKCDLIFSTAPIDDEHVAIEIFGKKEGSDYLAIGFSEDDKMGNDAVTACLTSPKNGADLYLGFNPGPWHEPLDNFTEKDAKLMASAAVDDFIYCRIQQAKKSSKKQLPDFDKSYQILFARGPRSANNGLDVHTMASAIPELVDVAAIPEPPAAEPEEIDISDPAISTVAPSVLGEVKFANTTGVSEDEPTQPGNKETTTVLTTVEPKPVPKGTGPFSLTGPTKVFLVRLHGLFMMIGWIGMIGIGIFSARYMKKALPDSRVAGIHVWFHFHRNLNFLAVVLVVLASVLIFVAKDFRWTGPRPDRPAYLGAWHSLVGLISVILAVLQPMLALLRCAPTDSKRPIFNWTHRSIGIIAVVLAVVATIFATIRFSVWKNRDDALTVMVLYTVISILLIVGLEAYNIIREKNKQKIGANSFEMRGPSKYSTVDNGLVYPTTQRTTKDTLVNLLGYLVFSGISIATVVILILFLF